MVSRRLGIIQESAVYINRGRRHSNVAVERYRRKKETRLYYRQVIKAAHQRAKEFKDLFFVFENGFLVPLVDDHR